jgi:hypothetical protein
MHRATPIGTHSARVPCNHMQPTEVEPLTLKTRSAGPDDLIPQQCHTGNRAQTSM